MKKIGTNSTHSQLEALITPKLRSLGYELLDLEYQARSAQDGPLLRVFIENSSGEPISFDDCAAVDHGLDTLFESPDFETLLPVGFTLEVSSPGLDRPLKRVQDFQRFAGEKALLHTYRPLTLEELKNEKYFEHHKKQKKFSGTLREASEDFIALEVDGEKISIPFDLIAKANLDVVNNLSTEKAKV